VAELEAVGVRRISLAAALYRTALTALREAALEMRERRTFGFVARAMPGSELAEFMAPPHPRGTRYSARSAIIGSTRVARRAGTSTATADTTTSKSETAPYVSGSLGLT
jgi:hypothetical protein